VLILQPRRIGDVIVTTPVIDVVKAAFPSAIVDFLVEPGMAPVLTNYPGLNEALVFDKNKFWFWLKDVRRRRYDWVLDFMNNPRTAQLTLASGAPVRAGFETPGWGLVYNVRIPRPATPVYAVQNKFNLLRALGLTPPTSGVWPRLPVAEQDFDGLRDWWAASPLAGHPVLALMPAHRHAVRQWPPEKFAAVMDLFLKGDDQIPPGPPWQKGGDEAEAKSDAASRRVALVGGPGEEDLLDRLAAAHPGRAVRVPHGPLRQAAAVFRRCRAALTNDSGLMHLAVASGIPTVTVYGPTTPGSWNPGEPPHRWFQAEGLACVSCNRDRCPFGHECMAWVSAERVARTVEDVWAAAETARP
jgi:ADP-heptose:LPS heptosyltransferase